MRPIGIKTRFFYAKNPTRDWSHLMLTWRGFGVGFLYILCERRMNLSNISAARNNRFQVKLNRVLNLLTFTFFRAGNVPEYEFSLSKQEFQETPAIMDIFQKTIKEFEE